jgi:hypothetical protein
MPDDKRIMVEFELHGFKSRQKRWWLMFEDGEADLCNKDPGHEIDLYVKAHIRALTEIWMGRRLDDAMQDETLMLEGSLRHVRNFPKWFSLNSYAPTAPQTNPATLSTTVSA